MSETTNLPDSVTLIIPAREKDLGGFFVRRVLPFAKHRMVGPWIFFDHMGPANFPAGEGVNVRPHPHINLATVTYLFEGHIWHRDSLGSDCVIAPGDINLMVAGKGIVHSERTVAAELSASRSLDGLQLWLALPEADEEMDPVFFHYDASDIPGFDDNGTAVRLMMGSAYGLTSPVKTYADTLYVDVKIQAGNQIQVPMGVPERAIYVVDGELDIDGVVLPARTMAVLKDGAFVDVRATTTSHFVVIGGEALSERHIYWNFVSSRPERIEQAKQDWKAGLFAKVPGDDQEFIPLPE